MDAENDWERVLGNAKLISYSARFRALVNDALSRFPEGEPQVSDKDSAEEEE